MLCKCLSRESERGGKEDDKTRENLTSHHHINTSSHYHIIKENKRESQKVQALVLKMYHHIFLPMDGR